KLSVAAKPAGHWRSSRQGMAAARNRDIQRIVEFLHGTLATVSRPGALAVVPVDDTRAAALSVMSLAASLAQQDARVVVADLCSGAPAAKLVGLKDSGVHSVQVDGAQISVAIPDPHEIAPVGPFNSAAPQSPLAGQVAAACTAADVV